LLVKRYYGANMAPSAHTWKKRGFATREAGEYIGRSSSWLRKKRLRGNEDSGDPGPRYLTPESGSAIYLKEDLDNWLDGLATRMSSAAALQNGDTPSKAA
jgi:hypothetical protein